MAHRFHAIHFLLAIALTVFLPQYVGLAQTGPSDGSSLYLPLLITPAGDNHSPSVPANPFPADQAGGQAVMNLTLSWSGGDPDGDAVTYSVYLDPGASNPTTIVSAGQAAARYTVSSLLPGTTYAWKVIARDSQGATTASPVWRFTTMVVDPLPIQSQPIAAGSYHTCALTQAGAAKCWGDNQDGQLGDGTSDISPNSPNPEQVVGLTSGTSAIAAGDYHTCALTQAGGVLCWGDNFFGQLGNGTSENASDTPLPVTGLASGVSAIAAGRYHTCILTRFGGARCWGNNGNGQLGTGDYTSDHTTPVDVLGLASGVRAIAAGGYHTCALTQAGAVYCWGENDSGQLGNSLITESPAPVQVTGLPAGVRAIAAGGYHTCALTEAGAVYCWGENDSGQLGNGTVVDSPVPVQVTGLPAGMSAIAAGEYHTCALTQTGGAKCWGDDSSFQLGDGEWSYSPTPVDVVGLASGVIAIAPGGGHTCALADTGGALCWGRNNAGQLGTGVYTYALTPDDVIGFP